ncbi:MAG: hypothetical protein NC200_07625 [Candidatus Gastranaerophilales bacterium]|nr:hypothetical protein [Candidatus Gastranaerophilales bacterium]
MDYDVQIKPYTRQNMPQTNKQTNSLNAAKNNTFSKMPTNQISFAGSKPQLKKQMWLKLKNLSGSMNEVTEFTNAFIAAIGTGIIAPAIILCSPGKGDKEDKDKKAFQAIRQPLSAGFALGFQVPATFLVNNAINNLAYKNNSQLAHKFFDDNVLGALIPDKKFIAKHIKKDEITQVETEFNSPDSPLKKQLENKIRTNYEEVGLEITDEELAKEINKRKNKFIKDTIVERKHNDLLKAKLTELSAKNIDIKDTDLVTGELKDLVAYRHKDSLNEMRKEAKLSIFDKAAEMMGFETKKLKELKARQDAFNTEKGIEILRSESPELFTDKTEKLKKYINVKNTKAQKIFGNKKFWLSLGVNLFMVSASCYALNWAHPKLKALIDNFKKPKQTDNQSSGQAVPTEQTVAAVQATTQQILSTAQAEPAAQTVQTEITAQTEPAGQPIATEVIAQPVQTVQTEQITTPQTQKDEVK